MNINDQVPIQNNTNDQVPIQLYLTKQEADLLAQRAFELNMPFADYLKMVLKQHLERNKLYPDSSDTMYF